MKTAGRCRGDKLSKAVEKKRLCYGDKRVFLPDSIKQGGASPVLLTRCDAPGDCSEVAGARHRMVAPKHRPILHIRTTSDVMTGHNDIWNPTMQGILVQFLLYIVERPESASAN